MTDVLSRAHAEELDAGDPLALFREEFAITDAGVCYLDGNSLGRLPRATVAQINSFLDEWAADGVLGWSRWIDSAQRCGDLLAATALGAAPGQTLVCDTTSVNFYQLCSAAVAARPGRSTIITDAANFPTDRYILEGIAQSRGMRLVLLDNAADGEVVSPEMLAAHLNDDVALVSLQVVQYRAGGRQDVQTLTHLARDHGALVVWDAAHAVGSVELDLDANGVDLAVGCTYKYLNSGPGAPAWMYVNKRMQDELQVPIQGWFAQADQFAMGPHFDRVQGIRGFQVASPSLIGITCVTSSLQMIARAGMGAIAQKASQGTAYMIALYDGLLAELGIVLQTPREPHHRGGHIALGHPDALAISTALREKHQVITDFRAPDGIRVAVSPLANSYTEVWEGFQRIRDCLLNRTYADMSFEPGRVT